MLKTASYAFHPLAVQSVCADREAATPAFLRTLLSDKYGIGSYVKHINVYYLTPIGHFERGRYKDNAVLDFVDFSKQTRLHMVHAMQRCSDDAIHTSQWLQTMYMRYQNWSAAVALVPSLLPNLRTIRIYGLPYTATPDQYLEYVFRKASELQNTGNLVPHSMAKLRSVYLERVSIEDNRSITLCLMYLTLKSLTSFRAHQIADDDFVRPEGFVCGVTELILIDSSLAPGALKDFLQCFLSLTKLEVELTDEVEAVFLPSTFGEAIGHLKLCLEELVIVSTDTESFANYIEEEFRGSIGSLGNFEKLRRVDASAEILFRTSEELIENSSLFLRYRDEEVERFIRSLLPLMESLTIRDCSSAIVEVLSKLISGNAPPSLNTIKVVFPKDTKPYIFKWEKYQNWGELQRMALEKGILLNGQVVNRVRLDYTTPSKPYKLEMIISELI
jgi:hypothetical protein